MQVLNARGELTPEQARFMAPARPPEELYDLSTDPHEVRNLIDDPGYTAIVERMRKNLDDWIDESRDMGQEPEDPRIAARVYRELSLPNQIRTMERRGLPIDISPTDYLAWWEKQFHIRDL